MPPDRGLSDKKTSGVKGSKVRLTYLMVSNADGSEKLPPLIIGKAKKPRAFGNKSGMQHGFHYRNNAKAWMTADIYREWLQQWNHDLGTRRRKIVLLQDNFSGHIVPDGLQNIRVINFKPNLTAHVQPLDQGIISSFKSHYRSNYVKHAIDRYDTDITPSHIYNINQLEAMQLARIAWHEVDTTTIRNCWLKAGILPTMDTSGSPTQPAVPISSLLCTPPPYQDPIAMARDKLRSALDDLEATGLLQSKNRMDIDDFLDPPEESWMTEVSTDEDICQAVLAAHNEQEGGASGDDDVEGDAPEPYPTYREVIQAASVMNRHVGCVDSPGARRFEVALASFVNEVRSGRSQALTTSHITDYFCCK